MAGTSAGAKKGWMSRKKGSYKPGKGRGAGILSKGAKERKSTFEAGAKKRIASIKKKQKGQV